MNPDAHAKLGLYYRDVSAALAAAPVFAKVAFVVVAHVLPDAPDFVEAIAQHGRIAAVIPKTSHRDPKSFHALSSRFPVPFPENYAEGEKPKDQLRNAAHALAFLKAHLRKGEKLILLDHGGYFAAVYGALHGDAALRKAVIGITEATENGQQKYEAALRDLPRDVPNPIPVFSRARSVLKAPEDHNVGTAIVHSTENILRNVDGLRIKDCHRVGVFGFGKIGRSIAASLKEQGVRLAICDRNPIVAALAVSMGFRVVDKASILREADMIFCSTGGRILRGEEWASMKNGVYIASATSADDEFDHAWLYAHGTLTREGENYAYQLSNGKIVNVLLNGDAVNFVDKSVLGPSVLLPEAETLATALHLLAGRAIPPAHARSRRPAIQMLPLRDKEIIASYWMKHFAGLDMTGPRV